MTARAQDDAWRNFVSALDTIKRDPNTGAQLACEAYAELPGRGPKGKARYLIQDYIDVAVRENNLEYSKILSQVSNDMRIGNGGSVGVRRKERLNKYLEHVTALQVAFSLLAANPPAEFAELLPADWLERLPLDQHIPLAKVYREWDVDDPDARGPAPKVSEVERRAALISLGKSGQLSGRRPSTNAKRGGKGKGRKAGQPRRMQSALVD